MNIEKLIDVFDLNEEVLEELPKKVKPLFLAKGQNFIESGNKVDKIGVLVTGLLTAKFIDDEGSIHTTKIYYNNGHRIITDYNAFMNNLNSDETIAAIEDSHLFVISKTDFNYLFNKYDSIKMLAKDLLDFNYLSALQRIRQLQTLSTEKKVRDFITQNRTLLNKISRTDLASYLGMHRNMFTKALKQI